MTRRPPPDFGGVDHDSCGVTSLLDLLGEFQPEEVEAAVQATRGLGREVPAPASAVPGGSPVRPCSNSVRTADWV